jgi:formylmethanofuran dehydrogenase subunit D
MDFGIVLATSAGGDRQFGLGMIYLPIAVWNAVIA